jgi:hypothetical protein
LAFKPPLGFLPSLRVHAGDLAIEHRTCGYVGQIYINAARVQNTFAGQ